MEGSMMDQLHFHCKTLRILSFFPVLQTGIEIPVENSMSVQAILSEICGLTDAVIKDRIQTLFLNGNPVDDFTTAMVNSGDTLALSAAMPGLVGATMRSAGKLACFRSNISHRGSHSRVSRSTGTVSLKLFNLLLNELGPGFLSRGVLISADKIGDFLKGFSSEDWQAFDRVTLNGKAVAPEDLAQMQWPDQMVELQVTFG
jgi:hypothetical protein